MRRIAPLFLSGLVALAACSDEITPLQSTAAAPSFDESAGSDTYLVRFKGNGVPAGFASQVSALGGEVIFAHPSGIAAVAGLSSTAAGQLAATSDIAAVDADAYTAIEDAEAATVEAADAAVESPANPALAVRYPRQWNMQVIRAAQAWNAGKRGAASVKVGILDTGIDYLHPDLAGRVDLALSKSFLSAAENARVQATFPGAHEIADLNYHGTHVAATVASNAYIAAGVSSGVTLVGLKVCSPGTAANGFRGSCPTSGTLAAILYAADNGIPVINMSLGGRFNRRDASAAGGFGPSFLATINQVFNYAHRKGTTVVVSAGNDALDIDHDGNGYKSYCSVPTVICVSATGPTGQTTVNGPWANIDALASYSNYGRSAISVAAPGGNGVSITAACSGFTIVTSLLPCRGRFYNSPTSWSGFSVGISGTSMASPHVAGFAALIASEGNTSPAHIRSRIQQSADDLGQAGTDPAYGKGRINVGAAFGL
ncbi:MAG TPA: S8 family serine peptidase [Longimicrobium sp.]|jgi:subtilisin family serine protease|uniref:S8 family serine peptidase n=1 Tax=Longimicrobium sp. TaxID=2029185 RepID=UPI002ED8F109